MRVISRWQAAAIHLGLSAVVAGILVALIRFVWYPGVYFDAMGGKTLLLLLVGCDVVIGPLITLIVFKRDKPRLKFDLSVIACAQILALAYGSYTMFNARPAFVVFAIDRFEVVAANDIRPSELARAAYPEFRSLPVAGPTLVAATLPIDQDERLAITFDAMQGGDDIKRLPRRYLPYAQLAAEAARKALPLGELPATRKVATMQELQSLGLKPDPNLGVLPVAAREKGLTAIVDRTTGAVLAVVPVDPW